MGGFVSGEQHLSTSAYACLSHPISVVSLVQILPESHLFVFTGSVSFPLCWGPQALTDAHPLAVAPMKFRLRRLRSHFFC